MSAYKKLITDENELFAKNIDSLTSNLNELLDDKLYNYFKFAETGDVSYLEKETEKLKGLKGNTSTKENVEPNSSVLSKKRTKRNKTGSTLANSTFSTVPQIAVKQEKFSVCSVEPSTSNASSVLSETSMRKIGNLKSETDDMPAPAKLPPRKKKIKTEPVETITRSTRTRTKPRHIEVPDKSDKGKPSDVIVQNTTIPMIDISEDKDPEPEKTIDPFKRSSRTTRTKTRQQKKQEVEEATMEPVEEPVIVNNVEESNSEASHSKRIRSRSRNQDNLEKAKKAKSSSSNEQDPNKTGQTDYEDALSEYPDAEKEEIKNATMVINATMVVENPTVSQKEEAKTKDWKTPPRTKSKKQQIKEIFSPYEKSSLKKKVEAFEKFGSATKETAGTSKVPLPSKNPGPSKNTKIHTPFSSKFIPKSCSTAVINKNHPAKQNNSQYNDSGLSMRTLSAMKASQAEIREREKRRQKEMEAQTKKEALLQAQAEEKKRKREEKQLKAQQQRELIEKEKEKQLELQRLKDEKHKHAVAAKEERIQKSKEEAEKKRLLAKDKAKMLKEKEESQAIQKQQEQVIKASRKPGGSGLPIYMTTRAPPLLPTDTDASDDDEEFETKKVQKPAWARGEVMQKQLYAQLVSGEKIKHKLFCSMEEKVDLVDMFENIDPRKLKRSSSAQWRAPPRYTLFSQTSDIHFSEDSEDEVEIIMGSRTKH